jgi:hypothetical protein
MGIYPTLEIPSGKLGSISKTRRLEAIEEAISWPRGKSQKNQVHNPLYHFADGRGSKWVVALCKPGKEAFQEKRNNPNDMFPRISRNSTEISYDQFFSGIWEVIEDIGRAENGRYAVELIGRFIAAATYMSCHVEIQPGVWRISEADDMKQFFNDLDQEVKNTGVRLPGGMPIKVFLYLIESIALQEDVKYFTLEGNKHAGNKGRVNNLLTTAAICRYITGKEKISWLVGGLSRTPPGVFSITQENLREYFPPILKRPH